MKKLGLVVAAASAGAATAAVLVGAGAASAQPIEVTGQTYAMARAILKGQGYTVLFGGSVGHDMPQNMCIVTDVASMSGSSTVRLQLDCTRPEGIPPGQPIPGANGVNTITLTPVPNAGTPPIG
ncbi:MAG: hypothetical protein ACSLE6_01475 [Mycobacterium sp.]